MKGMMRPLSDIEILILRDLADGGMVLRGINEWGDRTIRFPNGETTTARGAFIFILECYGLIEGGGITDAGRDALRVRGTRSGAAGGGA